MATKVFWSWFTLFYFTSVWHPQIGQARESSIHSLSLPSKGSQLQGSFQTENLSVDFEPVLILSDAEARTLSEEERAVLLKERGVARAHEVCIELGRKLANSTHQYTHALSHQTLHFDEGPLEGTYLSQVHCAVDPVAEDIRDFPVSIEHQSESKTWGSTLKYAGIQVAKTAVDTAPHLFSFVVGALAGKQAGTLTKVGMKSLAPYQAAKRVLGEDATVEVDMQFSWLATQQSKRWAETRRKLNDLIREFEGQRGQFSLPENEKAIQAIIDRCESTLLEWRQELRSKVPNQSAFKPHDYMARLLNGLAYAIRMPKAPKVIDGPKILNRLGALAKGIYLPQEVKIEFLEFLEGVILASGGVLSERGNSTSPAVELQRDAAEALYIYGQPGTGKTTLTDITAKLFKDELDVHFIPVAGGFGSVLKKIDKALLVSRSTNPIIILDEAGELIGDKTKKSIMMQGAADADHPHAIGKLKEMLGSNEPKMESRFLESLLEDPASRMTGQKDRPIEIMIPLKRVTFIATGNWEIKDAGLRRRFKILHLLEIPKTEKEALVVDFIDREFGKLKIAQPELYAEANRVAHEILERDQSPGVAVLLKVLESYKNYIAKRERPAVRTGGFLSQEEEALLRNKPFDISAAFGAFDGGHGAGSTSGDKGSKGGKRQ